MTDTNLISANPQPSPPAPPLPKKHHGYLWALLALTALSAFLCFNRLSQPPLLIDECFTYWRVCGNLDQLLDTLRNDAFMPLHYEILNWIGQGFPLGFGLHLIPGGISLTPAALRFIPALCGTLMTPVMYFLARQLFNRRTALIAAALITCSAYSLFFSRNAKMYAPTWTFETLTIACFCWWIRTWRRDAWLCWIAAGVAAAGFHVMTLLMLPITLLYFLSMGRFSRWRIPMLLLGMAIIAAGPAVYYGVFNRWTQNSGGLVPGVGVEPVPDANWQASGLDWIPPTDDSIRVPFEALNNYLSGYQWSDLSDLTEPPQHLQKYASAMLALAVVTYGLLILGALPWPHLRRIRAAARLSSPKSETELQPWWRSLLWLSLWIVLPVYCFFYCRSVDNFSPPTVWLSSVFVFVGPHWLIALLGTVAVAALLNHWPRLARFFAIPLLLLAVDAIAQTSGNHLDWLNDAAFPASRLALAILIPALLFHYAGITFRDRLRQLLRLTIVMALILALCEGAYFFWGYLHARSIRKHPELPWQSLWVIRYVAMVLPAVWLAAAALISRLPTRALQIAAVLTICSYNLANGLARQYEQTEVPLDRAMADVFQSQPNSDARTYFDLRFLTNNAFYQPLATYNACIAAGLRPTPAEFRNGKTWPFQWGRVAAEFKNRCIYNPTISAAQLHDDMAANPQVTRVITWQVSLPGNMSISWLGDPVTRGLGPGWTPIADDQIIVYYYWNWSQEWLFRRREFHRTPPAH